MTDPGNEPAFPITDDYWKKEGHSPFGLTKREWFAGMAMMGIVSASLVKNGESIGLACTSVAKLAYDQADAMLEAGK